MKTWNLVIDSAKCTNCNNCVVATLDENLGNAFEGYSKPGAANLKVLDVERRVRGSGSMVDVQFLPKMCNHCADAPCVKAADGAIRQRADGIVLIDPVKAIGRRDLVDACPYGMIVWNEEQNVPQAWNFDAHLLDQGWDAPRCVQSCPTDALTVVHATDQEMRTKVVADRLSVLRPELETGPRVYYKNASRFFDQFIGGNVTRVGADGVENVAGAEVVLTRDGAVLSETRTDDFGDFIFDDLPNGSGGYAVNVSCPECADEVVTIKSELSESIVLNVTLSAA